MATTALEQEDHARDAQFAKVLHGQTTTKEGGLASMMGKDKAAQKAAVDEYFKHWDNKGAGEETEETRAARRSEYATLTKQ
jgi:sterol 24-C-methyltransferase